MKKSNVSKVHMELVKKSKSDIYILFHGMFSDSKSEDMSQTKELLLKKRYSVLLFDYPGHGNSYGDLDGITLNSIFDASDAVIDSVKDYKNIYLLGFSFGANPLIYQASKLKNLKGIILFNPATNMLELVFRNKTQEDLDNYTKKHRVVNLTAKLRFFLECLKHNNYRLSKKITCPVYIYHIKNDNSVPVSQSIKLKKRLINSILVSEKKSDHSMDFELKNGEFNKKILPKALSWVEKKSI